MIFHRTAGIVLGGTDFSNTSKIVTLYTRDHGKIRVLAKGAKRKKSDFLGILEPFHLLEIVYIAGKRGLHILKEAHLFDSNSALRERLSRMAYGFYFLSLVERSQPEEDADPAVFELLASSLSALRRVSSTENVSIAFQLRLLRRFGRLPSFTSCAECGSSLQTGVSYGARWGGFLCEACGKGSRWGAARGTLKAMKRLSETSFERCGEIVLSKAQRVEIRRLTSAMMKAAIEAEIPAEGVVNSLLS